MLFNDVATQRTTLPTLHEHDENEEVPSHIPLLIDAPVEPQLADKALEPIRPARKLQTPVRAQIQVHKRLLKISLISSENVVQNNSSINLLEVTLTLTRKKSFIFFGDFIKNKLYLSCVIVVKQGAPF
jgi:hypothetical protein